MQNNTLPTVSQIISSSSLGIADKDVSSEEKQTTLRVKGSKDTTSKLLSALKRRSERDTSKGESDYTRSSDRVLSTVKYTIQLGLKPFDAAVGGLPFGKLIEIYGLDASGKTALSMLACGAAKAGYIYEKAEDGTLKKVEEPYDVTIFYIDNENSLDEGDRLVVYGKEVDCITGECDTIDKMFKDIETCYTEIEKIQKETKRLQFLVVVVDTVAGTSTREEVAAQWGKQDYARQPIQLRQGFRNTIRELKKYNICLICTNQVSDSFKPKPKFGGRAVSYLPQESDFSAFGGKALRYYAHIRIFVFKLPNNGYKLSKGMFADGFVVHFFTSKNRFKMPLRSGRLVLLFKNALGQGINSPGGYSPLYSVLEHLVYMKFVTIGATGQYNFNFEKYGISTTDNSDLQKSDDEDGKITTLEDKSQWLEFYQKYEKQVDRLFDISVEKMFSQNGVSTDVEGDEMELDDDLNLD